MLNLITVIPAKNEANSIKNVIEKLYKVNRKYKYGKMKVLVISDSTDCTDIITKKSGATVIRGKGAGLGAAMLIGLKESSKLGPDIILSIDADGQFDPEEIPKVIEPIMKDHADLVLGSRFLKPNSVQYKMPLVNKIGNVILSWIVRRITKLPITDAQTGFRAMKKEVARSMEIIGVHTYVQEMIIDAAKKGFRISEVPVKFKKRKYGNSKVVSSVRKYAIKTLPILILRAVRT